MTKSAFWRAGALALAAALVLPTIVPGLALATEAKHAALNGSLMHPTSAELNAFAHKGASMDNFVEITTGPYGTGQNGTGRLLFGIGESMKMQVQVNDNGFPARGLDYFWGGTSMSDNPVYSAFGYTPAQIVDMDVIGSGSNMAWSAGLSLAQNKDETSGSGSPTDKNNTLGFGLRASAGNDQFDVGAEVSRISNTNESSGNTDPADDSKVDSNAMAFGAYAQMYQEAWQYTGALAVGTSNDGNDATPDDPGFLAILAAAGYNLQNDDDGRVTAELHVQYMKTKNTYDPDTDYYIDYTDIYVPGCELAVDHKVGDRFRVYAAADASWVTSKEDGTSAADSAVTYEIKSSDFYFDWTSGLGFAIFDNVQLDFVLQTANLDQLLSLGNNQPLIAQISANVTY